MLEAERGIKRRGRGLGRRDTQADLIESWQRSRAVEQHRHDQTGDALPAMRIAHIDSPDLAEMAALELLRPDEARNSDERGVIESSGDEIVVGGGAEPDGQECDTVGPMFLGGFAERSGIAF